MQPIIRFFVGVSLIIFCNVQAYAQCDSIALAHDSLQWVVEGRQGSTSLSGEYATATAVKRYKDTLYVAGNFDYVGRYTGSAAAFDTASGEHWKISTWPRVNGVVENIVSDGADGVIIVGTFTRAGDSARQNVVRIDSSGNVTALKANANARVKGALVHNGILYIGGNFTTINGTARNRVAALNLSTGALTSWNPNVNGAITSILTNGTDIFIGGAFSTAGGASRTSLASLNMTTGAATSLNVAVSGTIYTMALSGDVLYIAGTIGTVGGQSRGRIASVNVATNSVTSWNPNIANQTTNYPFAEVRDMVLHGGRLYVVGRFDKIGNLFRGGSGAIDTATGIATNWGAGVSGLIMPGNTYNAGSDLKGIAANRNKIYVVGRFGRTWKGGSVWDSSMVNFAAIDTSTNYGTTPVIRGSYDTNTSDSMTHANTVEVVGGRVYIGGKFGSMGGKTRRNIAGIDLVNNKLLPFDAKIPYSSSFSYATDIDVVDDTIYTATNECCVVAYAINNNYAEVNRTMPVLVKHFRVKGNHIYVSGDFNYMSGGVQRTLLTRVNRSNWALDSWDPGIPANSNWTHEGNDFILYGEHALLSAYYYVFGQYYDLAKYYFPTDYLDHDQINGSIQTFAASGRKIFIGGRFPNGGYAVDSTEDLNSQTWNPQVKFINYSGAGIATMAAAKDRVYLGGFFDSAGGVKRRCFAVVDTVNGAVMPWKPRFALKHVSPLDTNHVEMVKDIEVSGNGDTVFVAGDFNEVDGRNLSGLARFHFNTFIQPAVTISTADDTVCAGTSVTITTTTNVSGGSYQWKKNDTVQTSTGSSFTFTPQDDDTVVCIFTAPSGCNITNTATSNKLIIVTIPSTIPTISFTASDDSVCAGDTVHYIAGSNMTGGSYQWRVGGTNVATGTTYSYPPANGDVVRCVVTKAMGTCYAPDTIARDTTMTVLPNVVPVITITATADSVCPGRADTLIATTNVTGGSYQWLVNGSTAGTNSNTYIYQPANNDVVECIVNAASAPGCYLPDNDTSNAVSITHTSSVIPSVTISVSPDTVICAGTSLTFTAAPTNGGTNPVYQWYRNGSPVSGATQNPYSGTGWQNNDVISCEMTSTATCPIPDKDTSDGITIHVTPVTTPTVSISANPGTTISQGTMVTFTATATNIGTSTAYQWYLNSSAISGAVNSTYMSNTLADMDLVTVTAYSNDSCSNPDSATSNVLTLTVTSSVDNIAANNSIRVYPNPVNDKLTIVSGSRIESVEILNLYGQKLIVQEGTGKTEVVNMSSLVPGIYIIKVNNSFVSRVVKE